MQLEALRSIQNHCSAHQGGMDCLTMVKPDVTISTNNMTPPAHQPLGHRCEALCWALHNDAGV